MNSNARIAEASRKSSTTILVNKIIIRILLSLYVLLSSRSINTYYDFLYRRLWHTYNDCISCITIVGNDGFHHINIIVGTRVKPNIIFSFKSYLQTFYRSSDKKSTFKSGSTFSLGSYFGSFAVIILYIILWTKPLKPLKCPRCCLFLLSKDMIYTKWISKESWDFSSWKDIRHYTASAMIASLSLSFSVKESKLHRIQKIL